jgi:hypothetical protein
MDEKKIIMTRITGESRTKVEYSVDSFVNAYAINDEPDSMNSARALAQRLVARQ